MNKRRRQLLEEFACLRQRGLNYHQCAAQLGFRLSSMSMLAKASNRLQMATIPVAVLVPNDWPAVSEQALHRALQSLVGSSSPDAARRLRYMRPLTVDLVREVWERYLDGQSFRQIASCLHLHPSVVRKYHFHARRWIVWATQPRLVTVFVNAQLFAQMNRWGAANNPKTINHVLVYAHQHAIKEGLHEGKN